MRYQVVPVALTPRQEVLQLVPLTVVSTVTLVPAEIAVAIVALVEALVRRLTMQVAWVVAPSTLDGRLRASSNIATTPARASDDDLERPRRVLTVFSNRTLPAGCRSCPSCGRVHHDPIGQAQPPPIGLFARWSPVHGEPRRDGRRDFAAPSDTPEP
jgi:hypothetical protein